MATINHLMGEGGLFESSIEKFKFRPQQLEMAQAIDKALSSASLLVCEAGTGTGKTFAYLVPAILSGRKVLISTGTKNLQDQLYKRDLPHIRQHIDKAIKTALLKGRSNYICIHRLKRAEFDQRSHSPVIAQQLAEVRKWFGRTQHGDIAELPGLPDDASVWPLVTSTQENCLGTKCDHFSDCYLTEARRRAQEADIVIINHHLLCADFALKEGGFGELLPEVDACIIDEAHQLAEIATYFFGSQVSSGQITELLRDARIFWRQASFKEIDIEQSADQLEKSTKDFRLLLGLQERRAFWSELAGDAGLSSAMQKIGTQLQSLIESLESLKGTETDLDALLERSKNLLERYNSITDTKESENSVRWFETSQYGFRLSKASLQIAQLFRKQMLNHASSWIFTSATLAVDERFDHFCNQLGLEQAQTHKWDSPFDYQRQSLWYMPKGLVEPQHPEFVERLVKSILPVIRASDGRAFLLFTSYRTLNQVAEWLEGEFDFPLLVQGTASKTELIDRFRELGNAILLATNSFWEGVDVQGDALSLVMIDKLPFASPGDPLMKGRIDAMRNAGGNPFFDYQLPQATIALKQGAGRLIRGVDERGVLMTCDLRLVTKGYGKTFVNSLPPFPRTRELSDVEAFFKPI